MEQKQQEHLLVVNDLHTSFNVPAGEVRSVSGISFSLDKGKILGIVGESGSGKSVTAASIMQILVSPGRIKSGSVVFEGEELVGMSDEGLRKIRGDKISMIFQDPMTALNPVYTIGHQMEEAMLLHKHPRVETIIAPQARTLRDDETTLTRLENEKKNAGKDEARITDFSKQEETLKAKIEEDKLDLQLAKEKAEAQANLEKDVAKRRYIYNRNKTAFAFFNAIGGGISERVAERARNRNEKEAALRSDAIRLVEKEGVAIQQERLALINAHVDKVGVIKKQLLKSPKDEKLRSALKQENQSFERAVKDLDEKIVTQNQKKKATYKEINESLNKAHKERVKQIKKKRFSSVKEAYASMKEAYEQYRAFFGATKASAYTKSVQMLTLVGVNEPEKRMKQYPYEFSGGMLQRVMIAMSLLGDPDLLIADEPTTALDVTIQAQILDLIKSIQKKLGMGVIIITHDLGVVAQICDEVDVMYAGRIVERGTVDDVFYKPKHEYTKGLLNSMPGRDASKDKRLVSIEGNPVDVFALPKGCSFAPRCEKCMEYCLKRYPKERQVGPQHYASCFFEAVEEYKAGKLTKAALESYFLEGFEVDTNNLAKPKPKRHPFKAIAKLIKGKEASHEKKH